MLRSRAPSQIKGRPRSSSDVGPKTQDRVVEERPPVVDCPSPSSAPSLPDCSVLLSQLPKKRARRRDTAPKCTPCSVSLPRLAPENLARPCSVRLQRVGETADDENEAKASSDFSLVVSDGENDKDVIGSSQPASTLSTPQPRGRKRGRKPEQTMISSFYEFPTFVASNGKQHLSPLVESPSGPSDEAPMSSPPPPSARRVLTSKAAPSRAAVAASSRDLPTERHREVHCSSKADVPSKGIELGLQKVRLCWDRDLPDFGTCTSITSLQELRREDARSAEGTSGGDAARKSRTVWLESVRRAPSRKDVQAQQQRQIQGPRLAETKVFSPVMRVRQDSGDSLGSEMSLSVSGSDISEGEADEEDLFEAKEASKLSEASKAKSPKKSANRIPKRRVSFQSQERQSGAESKKKEDAEMIHSSQMASPSPAPPGDRSLRAVLLEKVGRGRGGVASPSSPIQGVTPNNTYAFKMSLERLVEARAVATHQHLVAMSAEVFACTRQRLSPDPEFDALQAVFVAIARDDGQQGSDQVNQAVFVVKKSTTPGSNDSSEVPSLSECGMALKGLVLEFETEMEMLLSFIEFVKSQDPDVLVGYEVQTSSWGWLIERGCHLGINAAPMLSRLPNCERESSVMDEDGYGSGSELRVAGRIVLNVWRLLRSELAVYSYTFENMMYHALHQRLPKFEHETLTGWWNCRTHLQRWRVVEYFLKRAHGNLSLLEQLDLIGRTSELARLFGCQFTEVLSRGSQFRVESIMLRMAKRRNLVAVSPSVQQRARMKAPEYIPLVMEPESRFYVDPVVVLDFQSLYPSIIMAYNYCYSTCLGRVQNLFQSEEPYEFGCSRLKLSAMRLRKLMDQVTISPGGVAFLKPSVRRGLLPQMLEEILDTRFMVKRSMKLHGDADGKLRRVLHSRQLGLKLIANVTYGYTSANFSGRMPCMEVGDSVVSKGRETLERAIRTIEGNEEWRARVVYGDTDSVFVLLKGRSRDEAFSIGQEMAATITAQNPKPVKLKFEKVYVPCILQTKKRYVGFMYESRGQKEPKYDAKGIETVRRDGCPAVAKILEKSLRILFETKDVSRVKLFVQRQFQKIMRDRASLQDLTFAREFRGMQGYKPGALVPALELTRRFTRHDRRLIPRRGERVPYVVVHGEPGRPLIQSVRHPREVLQRWPALRPNAQYYILKVVAPPLNRCLSLAGANDVAEWYAELPKVRRPRLLNAEAAPEDDGSGGGARGRERGGAILRYFASRHCPACSLRLVESDASPFCAACASDPQRTALELSLRVRRWDVARSALAAICGQCAGVGDGRELGCASLDCPVSYRAVEAEKEAAQIDHVRELMAKLQF